LDYNLYLITILIIKEGLNLIIITSKAKEFIEECNKNKITDEFLEECREASKLFKREKPESERSDS